MNEPAAPAICARAGCTRPLIRRPRGRPRRYCSAACQVADRRARDRALRNPLVSSPEREPLRVELDFAPAEGSGRPAGHVWLVRLRRGERAVEVATGLGRPSAEYLAREVSALLEDDEPLAKGGAMR
jgi:hypothetical protein